jgi:hypothetical protein
MSAGKLSTTNFPSLPWVDIAYERLLARKLPHLSPTPVVLGFPFHPPAYRDWADYIVREDSRAVGRIYEDRHTLPGLLGGFRLSLCT